MPILDSYGNAYYVKKDGSGYGTAGKLANGQYALGEGERFATQDEIDGGFKNIAPPPPAPVLLGDYAKSKGLSVGWTPETGPTINGNKIDTTGLQLVNNHWQGTQEQIDRLLSPYVYTSPNQGRIDQAQSSYEDWLKTPYASQYAPMIQGLVQQILGRQFNYNPANDAQFQQASKELTRNVLETMNARGILNSTVTENQVQQGVADLMPQYQQIARQNFMNEGQLLMSQVDMLTGLDQTAYGRYQDEGTRLAGALDTVMKMDDNQYQKWKDAYEIRYQTERDKVNDALTKAETDRQKIKDAWDRTSELGYVDNESSIILGVPAGTLSKEAREAKTRREEELADQRTSFSRQLALIDAQYEKEKKISALKDVGSVAPETLGNENQVQQYYALRDIYFGGGNGKYADKPLDAYNWLVSHTKENVGLIGQKLYDKLLVELTDAMKTEKTYGSINDVKPSDYKTDPDFAQNVAYIEKAMKTNPEGVLQEVMDNADELIQSYGVDGYNYLIKKATPPKE
jgi:hypothetical protein